MNKEIDKGYCNGALFFINHKRRIEGERLKLNLFFEKKYIFFSKRLFIKVRFPFIYIER